MGATLRSLLIAGFLVGVMSPAFAQFYPSPGYGPPPADDDDDGGPPRYRPGYGPGPGYDPNPGYSPYRRYGSPRVGFHCATGRGICETGYPAPLRSPCRCDFGFEQKRGVVVR